MSLPIANPKRCHTRVGTRIEQPTAVSKPKTQLKYTKDGTPLLITPLHPMGRACIKKSIREMSFQTRYFRFLNAGQKPNDKLMDQLMDVDFYDRAAIVAVLKTSAGYTPAGLARYIRSDQKFHSAEFAITVLDLHQNQGIGTELMNALIRLARQNDITTFTAMLLAENRAIQKLIKKQNGTLHYAGDGFLKAELLFFN